MWNCLLWKLSLTSRVVTPAGDVLFYDGMVDDGMCSYDGNLNSMTVTSLHETRGRAMSMAVYYKVDTD